MQTTIAKMFKTMQQAKNLSKRGKQGSLLNTKADQTCSEQWQFSWTRFFPDVSPIFGQFPDSC